ncbi:MAG TPA: hypothetical protein VF678_12350, partial [bacterium]
MTTPFLELLANSGYFTDVGVDDEAVRKAGLEELLDFAKQATETTWYEAAHAEGSVLSHFASPTLSALPHPCASRRCRLSRAEETAQFATFYSDKIYIDNVFEDYTHGNVDHFKKSEERFRQKFLDDLHVYAYFRGFIEARRIIPISLPQLC